MLIEMMQECKNFFAYDKEIGKFTFNGSYITVSGNKIYNVGQYIYLDQSNFNDGLYIIVKIEGNLLYIEDADKDTFNSLIYKQFNAETFDGNIYLLRVPKDFINLDTEIEAYKKTTAINNVKNESFGNYSVTYAVTTDNSSNLQWQDIFRKRLNIYRRMHSDIKKNNVPRETWQL